MVSIEIAQKVAEIFLDTPKVMDTDHLPFEDFDIEVPMEMFLSKSQVERDIAGVTGTVPENMKDKVDKMMNEYLKSNIKIQSRKATKGSRTVTICDSRDVELFRYDILNIIPLPIVKLNKFTSNQDHFAVRINNLIGNTLDYINKPREEVEKEERREVKYSGKKSRKSKRNKTYINKTIYRVLSYTEPEEKRTYGRHLDSWDVRGHWRTMKTGKRIWVSSYTKGDKEKAQDKEYKITKV